MRFLFISEENLSGDLAYTIKKEGHEVKYCVINPSEGDKDIGDGFYEKVNDWEEYKDWADTIIFDDVGFGIIADKLREEGKNVIGGTVYTDRLEMDREFGQNEMKRVGMLVLPHWDFEDFNSAISFIKNNPGRYVFKPYYLDRKVFYF
jgi:phosphoribosylamine--glycine ligase